MTELYTEHLDTSDGIAHTRFSQLQEQDKRPEYKELRVVPSSSEDRAYLVAEVSALSVPFNQADIAMDRVSLYLCSCDDHWYNQSDSIENPSRELSAVGECKHCIGSFRELKAKADDNQETLWD